MTTGKTLDERLDTIDTQLGRISTAVIKGFSRIDNTLEAKADKLDIARILDIVGVSLSA